MEDGDIKYLLDNSRWISVQPTSNGFWEVILYKESRNKWKKEFYMTYETPNECYEWVIEMLAKVKMV